MQLAKMCPDEESALQWFEARFRPHGRPCGHCGRAHTKEARHAKMPYRYRDGRAYFSLKTDTLLWNTRSGRSASGCSPSTCT